MDLRIKERSLGEIQLKLGTITNDLSKISYMENALKESLTFDVKRFLYTKLAEIYSSRKMFDRAALAIANKIAITITFREKIETYIQAGELFAKASRLLESEQMFNKAIGEGNTKEKEMIKEKMISTFLENAEQLDKEGKRTHSIKFYERLLAMPISEAKKQEIKQKILPIYKALGKFAEARAIENN